MTKNEVAERLGIAPLLTLDELAVLAGESRSTIKRRIAAGVIAPAGVVRHSKRSTRITREAAMAYLAGKTATADSDRVVPLKPLR